jgi:hypothetical protein
MFHAQPATNIAAVARTMPRERGVDRYQAHVRGQVTSGPAASPQESPTGSAAGSPASRRVIVSSPGVGGWAGAGLYWDQRRRRPRCLATGYPVRPITGCGRRAGSRWTSACAALARPMAAFAICS